MRWLGVVVLAACQSGIPSTPPKPTAPITNAAPPASPLLHRFDVGFTHACARTSDARVACWGQNERGQLGDGTRIDRYTPVLVPGLTDIEGVAASDEHSCAWSTAGTVWCWGGNGVGEYTPNPVRIEIPPVLEVQAGGTDTCALLRDHGVRCWFPELWHSGGSPSDVPEARGATAIAVGRYTTVALMPGGTVLRWMPSTSGPTDMTKEPTLTGVTRVLADRGFSARFLVERDGTWLSYRMSPENNTAITVPLPTGFAPRALDELQACELAGGGVRCMALNPETDAFGTPAIIDNTAGAVDVKLSSTAPLSTPPMGCASFADGSLRCWGPATSLGAGERSTVERATDIPGLDDIVELTSLDDDAATATCARRKTGHVVCWGELGYIGGIPLRTPRDLGIRDAIALIADLDGVCVARGPKKVTCYSDKEPLDTTYRFTATSAPINGGWCDLDKRGIAMCTWPAEEKPTEQPEGDAHPVPRSVGPLRRIWPAASSGCAERRSDGTLACWFTDGRQGSPTFNDTITGTYKASVVDVATMPNYTVYSDYDFCFVQTDGHVACISTMSFDRIDVLPGVTDAVEIAVGNGGFCARTKAGRVACWSETFRRNAEPTHDGSFGAIAFIEGIDDAAHLAGNAHAMCALRANGHVACWGHRDHIGTGTADRGPTTVSALKL